MPASLTEILEWIDPYALPQAVQDDLEEFGPYLARGLTYREIAVVIRCSEDFIAKRVKRIREAMVAEALTRADDMSEALRERLEELQASYLERGVAPPVRSTLLAE